MKLFEVTVQWLSRRHLLIEAEDEGQAEMLASDIFKNEFLTWPVETLPKDADVLISDVSTVVEEPRPFYR